jgi:hypothetical protein
VGVCIIATRFGSIADHLVVLACLFSQEVRIFVITQPLFPSLTIFLHLRIHFRSMCVPALSCHFHR